MLDRGPSASHRGDGGGVRAKNQNGGLRRVAGSRVKDEGRGSRGDGSALEEGEG